MPSSAAATRAIASTPRESLAGKTVLVTGGAGGLGTGCARRFAALGARLILVDRDVAPANAAADELRRLGAASVDVACIDLSDADDVRARGAELAAAGRPIDVLVNNAGIYPPSQRTLNREGLELTLAITHFGHFRLTHALWPSLEAAHAARIITVSSITHREAQLDLDDLSSARDYMPIRAYARAKLANLLFTLELQRRLARTGSRIVSHAAHPGVTRTSIGRNRRRAEDDRWYHRMTTAVFAYTQSRFGQSPEQGAEPVVLAATAALDPGSFLGPTGFKEIAGEVRVVTPSERARDPELARALWERSEAITGLRWPI